MEMIGARLELFCCGCLFDILQYNTSFEQPHDVRHYHFATYLTRKLLDSDHV